MRLQKADNWRMESFEKDSRPTLRTVQRWIREGDIQGEIINGRYFVDLDAQATPTRRHKPTPMPAGDNPLFRERPRRGARSGH